VSAKTAVAETAPPAAQPAAEIPEPPRTPEQMPASPPKVTMSSGQLSIVADNSTLGEVLNAVKSLTGATVDAPSSASSERIAAQLGPGEPQQVLQQLLSGSKFDYIILGSPTNSTTIEKIILTARGAAGPGGANIPTGGAPVNNAGGQMAGRPGFQPPQMPDQNENAVDDETTQPEPPPPMQEEVTPPQPGAQQQIGPGGEQQQNGPKTPEQLLQELQRLQQQQGAPQRPQ
jgi:hypothetical protein